MDDDNKVWILTGGDSPPIVFTSTDLVEKYLQDSKGVSLDYIYEMKEMYKPNVIYYTINGRTYMLQKARIDP